MSIAAVLPIELERVLNTGDVAACVALFANATDKERASLAKLAVGRLRKLTAGDLARLIERFEMLNGKFGETIFSSLGIQSQQLQAAQVAVLACASLGELKRLRLRGVPGPEETFAVLAAGRPPWIDEWADFVCDLSAECWPVVRRLVREKLCKRPDGDGYTEGMLSMVGDVRGPYRRILDALMEDAELLEHDIWRIFELEPRPRTRYLLADWKGCPPEQSWSGSLVCLCDAGKLSRSRLLDATLDGLHRDFHEMRARWFAGLHDGLSPTIGDRAERADRYVSLLPSRNASTVLFALKSLTLLEKAERLDAKALFENTRSALGGRTKAIISAALKLLKGTAQRADFGDRAAILATEALLHDWPDIQSLAVDVIERLGRAEATTLRGLVQERLSNLAPSQRSRLATWLHSAGPVEAETPALADEPDLDSCLKRANAIELRFCELAGVPALAAICRHGGNIPVVAFEPMHVPRLDPQRRIESINDLDTLLERFAVVLENPESPDEVERVLDGVSRLCDQQPADFRNRIAPLKARAIEILNNAGRTEWIELALRSSLSILAVSWARDPVRFEWGNFFTVAEHGGRVFHARLQGIARRAARGRAAPLLSAPTHAGGWIDPQILVARAKSWQTLGQIPDNLDRAIALLRLAPDQRSVALEEARLIEGEFGEALRYALGGKVDFIGSYQVLWVAAARARAPYDDDARVEARHPGLGPDAGLAARYRFREGPHSILRGWLNSRQELFERVPLMPSSYPVNLPTVALHSAKTYGYAAGMNCWLGTVWPLARESFFAQGFEQIVGHESGQTDLRADRPFLEALFDPDVPLGRIGGLLLTGALSSNQAELSLLATDALIAAIDDGRLDGVTLGKALAMLLPSGLVKTTRLAKTLGAAAKISLLHGHVIAGALQHGLCGAEQLLSITVNWAGLASLLRLLKELLIEAGEPIRVAELRTSLRELKATANTAALIRELLELKEKGDGSTVNSAALYALTRRIERAERWSRSQAAAASE